MVHRVRAGVGGDVDAFDLSLFRLGLITVFSLISSSDLSSRQFHSLVFCKDLSLLEVLVPQMQNACFPLSAS